MNTTAQKLLDIKEQISVAQTDKAQAEGKLSALMEQLKKEFGVKTIKEAEALLIEMEEGAEKTEQAIKKGMEKLENAYDW